jgi:hypothetical protein
MRAFLFIFPCVMCFCTAGCSDPSQTADAHLSDVVVLAPSFTIGTAFGDSAHEFSSIAAIAVSQSGHVLIAEGHAGEIRVFDALARHEKTIGRRGHGPGEFQRIRSMATYGDTIAVLDVGRPSITLLSLRSGATIGTIAMESIRGGAFGDNAAQMHFLSDTTLVIGVGGPWAQGSQDRFDEARVYSTNGALLKRIRVQQTPGEQYRFESHFASTPLEMSLPFQPEYVWTLDPSGAAIGGWGGEYRLVQITFDGDTVGEVSRATAPLPIDSASLSAAISWTERMLQGFRATARGMAFSLPEQQAQFVALSVSDDGRQLWVRRTYWADDPHYDVFVDGQFRCTVKLLGGGYKATMPLPAMIAENRLYRVAFDSLEAEYVLAYRFEEAPGLLQCLR